MRLKLLSPGEMNEDQRQTYDESIAGKRGAPPPPMMAWLNSPEMARHATRLGGFLRFDTLFPAKLSEIAILVTARHWTSHYEWYAHKRLPLIGGMDPKIIDAIRDPPIRARGLVGVVRLCGVDTAGSRAPTAFEFGLPDGEVSELV